VRNATYLPRPAGVVRLRAFAIFFPPSPDVISTYLLAHPYPNTRLHQPSASSHRALSAGFPRITAS